MNSPACLRTASTTLGCESPTLSTEMPDAKSMSRFPSTSSTMDPWPRLITTGADFVVVAMYFLSRSITSRAFGPGGVTLMSGTFTESPDGGLSWVFTLSYGMEWYATADRAGGPLLRGSDAHDCRAAHGTL